MRLGSLNAWRELRIESPSVLAVITAVMLAIGVAIGLRSPSIGLMVAGASVVGIVLALRQDQFTALVIVLVSLIQDQYHAVVLPFSFPVVSVVIAFALLTILFFGQSEEHPWISVPAQWWWVLLLVLAAPHILQGVSRLESLRYFAQTFVSGFALWLVGVQVVRDLGQLRRLMVLLSVFAALIAIHSVILSVTGIFLFATPAQIQYLASVSNFTISGTTSSRAGSFIGSPDWNGTFMAMLSFMPIALVLDTPSRWRKAFYSVEFALIMLALFFTYSTAAWAALALGMVIFGMLIGNRRARTMLLVAIVGLPLIIAVLFPRELRVLIAHFTSGGQITLRLGAWITGLRIIAAHPLTGIGLGYNTYFSREVPYRVALQNIELGHPHDAYIELGAMGGMTVMIVFIIVLVVMFRLAIRAYRAAQSDQKILLMGTLVALVSITFNSVAINGWTFAPLAAIGWLLGGATCSPALYESLTSPTSLKETQMDAQSIKDQKDLKDQVAPISAPALGSGVTQ